MTIKSSIKINDQISLSKARLVCLYQFEIKSIVRPTEFVTNNGILSRHAQRHSELRRLRCSVN